MTVDERIEIINRASRDISKLLLMTFNEGKPAPPEELEKAHEMINGAMILVSLTVTALTEIAHSVGKLVEISERDFDAQVKSEAEIAATVKVEETKKRHFIGQPKNNS